MNLVASSAKQAVPTPQGLQGYDDENWPMQLITEDGSASPELIRRYGALGSMRPGTRRYNMFWTNFEPKPSVASGAKLDCPTGFEKHPQGPSEELHFKRQHCYLSSQLAKFDLIFKMDRRIGAQGAAIIYAAPGWAIEPNCTGFIFGKDVIKGGCAPRDDAMDDYEDYVLMLANRYGEHLKHFVVWNEVASAGWMDCSPHTPNRAGPNGENTLTDAQFDYWVEKYATLVKRTARALQTISTTAGTGSMIWTSNGRLWERPNQVEGEPLHTGVRPFLDRLWPKLGASNFSWNLAVHPYEPDNPMDNSEMAPGHHPQVLYIRYPRRRACVPAQASPSSRGY